MADGPSGENEYLFSQLDKFRVDDPNGGKPKFQYRIPGLGGVCRSSWVLIAGFPNRNNSRVRSIEAKIRRGETFQSQSGRKRNKIGLNSSTYAYAFLEEYILENSERSPVAPEL